MFHSSVSLTKRSDHVDIASVLYSHESLLVLSAGIREVLKPFFMTIEAPNGTAINFEQFEQEAGYS
jgi:hypothetical protein